MRLEHTALWVKDLEGAKEFFKKYFGAKANEMYHNPKTGLRTYFLSFEGGARLEIMSRPDICEKGGEASTGFAHIAFAVGSREKVDELSERLKNDGYEVVSGPRTTGDGYYESCIAGFEGNLIELTV